MLVAIEITLLKFTHVKIWHSPYAFFFEVLMLSAKLFLQFVKLF